MTLLVNTGIINSPNSKVSKFGNTSVDNTPSEQVIYPKEVDRIIRVGVGEMVVLTAYTSECVPVIVKKVLLSNGIPAQATGNGCCSSIVSGSETTILNSVAVPMYYLNADNPIIVITIPGTYTVSQPAGNDGNTVVTMMAYPLQEHGPQIPRISCNCTTCPTNGKWNVSNSGLIGERD